MPDHDGTERIGCIELFFGFAIKQARFRDGSHRHTWSENKRTFDVGCIEVTRLQHFTVEATIIRSASVDKIKSRSRTQ